LETNVGNYRFDGYQYTKVDRLNRQGVLLHEQDFRERRKELLPEIEVAFIDAIARNDSSYWILTEKGGPGIYDRNTRKIDYHSFIALRNPLYISPSKSFFFLDLQNNLWISGEDGLTLANQTRSRFEYLMVMGVTIDDANPRKITQLYVPEEGNKMYALSIQQGGLFILEKNTGRVLKQIDKNDQGVSLNFFYVERRENILYLYGNGGIFTFDLTTEKLRLLIDPTSVSRLTRFNHMYIDRQNTLWAATKNNGLFHYNLETKDSFYLEIDSLFGIGKLKNLVYEIREDPDGRIHLITDRGFYYVDEKEKKCVRSRSKWKQLNIPEGEQASGMAFIPDNRILISTFEKGFYLFDMVRDSLYRPQNENYNTQNISDLFLDKNQNVWACTQDGLLFFDVDNGHMQLFPSGLGFTRVNFLRKFMKQGEDGRMYVGLYNAILSFDPDSVFQLANNVRPVIEEVWSDDSLIYTDLQGAFYNGGLTLPHSTRSIHIQFKGISYGNEENIIYAYRLDGLDEDWVQSPGSRRVRYDRLSPGDYVFNLKILNNRTEQALQLPIRIKKPYWQEWWFYLLAFATLSLLFLGWYKYRMGQMRRVSEQQNAFNKKIAELEMKALRAQMNPHFLFNSLNSVKAYIGQNDNRKAQVYLGKFSQLMRRVLQNSKSKTVRLNDELEALRLYLDLEAMRFNPSFEYQIRIGEQVNEDFIETPPLILQPYIENAIWHGLMHKDKGDRKLLIDISRHGDYIKLLVEDNGIGRQRAAQMKTRSASKHQSMGMQITGDRLRYLKEMYGLDAKVTITDLQEEPGKDGGTRVEILLPIAD